MEGKGMNEQRKYDNVHVYFRQKLSVKRSKQACICSVSKYVEMWHAIKVPVPNQGVSFRVAKNPVTVTLQGFGEPSATRTRDPLIKSQML
jgi:hypothetical protein